MKKIKWDSSFEIGDHGIDDQHRELFDLANLIFAVTETNDGPEAFEASFEALCRYTDWHFREEEAHLENIGSPILALQRKQHAVLYTELRDLWTNPTAGSQPRTARALYQWLTGRLLVHIQFADRLAMGTMGAAETGPVLPARARKRAAAG